MYQIQAHHKSPGNLLIFQALKVSVNRQIGKYKNLTTILTEKTFPERSTGHNFNAVSQVDKTKFRRQITE